LTQSAINTLSQGSVFSFYNEVPITDYHKLV